MFMTSISSCRNLSKRLKRFFTVGGNVKYAARLGIIFVFALFASKVTPGFMADDQWYLLTFCLIIGLINALDRSVIIGAHLRLSWFVVGSSTFILNIFLYWLVFIGGFSWLGISVTSFGSAFMAAVIVTIVSALCNHFMGFKEDQQNKK